MRFSSFVAFLFPLSALAVPLVQRAPTANDLRQEILSGLQAITPKLPVVLSQGQAIQKFSQKAVVNDIVNVIKGAQENFATVVAAATNIATAIAAVKQPQDIDQAQFSVNILQIQVVLGKLQTEIADAISANPKDGNKLPRDTIDAINDLTGTLNTIKVNVDKVVAAGCGILQLQGKSLNDLVNKVGFFVPIGASCPAHSWEA